MGMSDAARSQFNAQLRANPEYRAFLQSMGVNPDAPVKLSGSQRSQAERWVRQRFPDLGSNLQIDPAGNVNTDHGLSTAWSNPYFRYPLIAGAAIGTMGAAGLFGGAGAGAGAAGGAGTAAGATGAAAGGSGVATGIGAAAAGGSFWNSLGRFVSSPFGSQLISTGGQLAGNLMQGRSNDRAIEAQLQANREALDFEKGVYEDDKRFFEPYAEMGRASVARLSDLLAQPRTPVTAESLFASGRVDGPSRAPVAAPRVSDLGRRPAPAPPIDLSQQRDGTWGAPGRSSGFSEQPPAAAPVMMEAPDGTRRDVPAHKVAGYEARGARRVA